MAKKNQSPQGRNNRQRMRESRSPVDTQSPPKVYIERAEPLTKEGITAICMSDEDYENYRKRKDKAVDTQSQKSIYETNLYPAKDISNQSQEVCENCGEIKDNHIKDHYDGELMCPHIKKFKPKKEVRE